VPSAHSLVTPATPVTSAAPPATPRPSDALGRSIADAIEQARHETPASPAPAPPASPTTHAPTPAPTAQAPSQAHVQPRAGGLHIEPGFEGQIQEPSLSPSEVRLSPTLGAPSQEPALAPGTEMRALMEDLPRLVPEHDVTRVSLVLAELSVQLDHGPVRWESIRGAMTLVMDYPGLARRAVPMLLRHFDAAA
jgi:hypothetical protein